MHIMTVLFNQGNLRTTKVVLSIILGIALLWILAWCKDDSWILSLDMDATPMKIYNPLTTQSLRQEKVRQACKKYNLEYQTLRHGHLKYILVDDRRRFMYCLVQKVASTNWKRVLMMLTGHVTDEDIVRLEREHGHNRNPSRFVHNQTFYTSLGIKPLHQYGKDEIRYRLDNYFKFMFVRHPFKRLISAYRDKFTLTDRYALPFQKKYGRHIIAKYRKDPTKEALKNGKGVTFEEFIRYLADTQPEDSFRKFNVHWQTFNNLCFPCGVKYDYLGHLETLRYDAEYIFSRISPEVTDTGHFFPNALCGPSAQRYNYSTDNQSLRHSFINITADTIAKLIYIYSVDFDLHGYHPMIF